MIEDRREENLKSSCKEFQANLEGYLERQAESGLPPHATECVACGSLLADLTLIQSAARTWPLETPAPRVWSNIRATLEAEGYFRQKRSLWERGFAPFRLFSSAAPVGALVFLMIFAVFLLTRGDLYRRSQPVSSSPAVVATSMAPAALTTVEQNLVQTVEGMEKSYKAREAYLDPSSQKTYERGLTSLDSSIHECLVSLQAQPQNTLARRYLMQAYSEKADILASALEYNGR